MSDALAVVSGADDLEQDLEVAAFTIRCSGRGASISAALRQDSSTRLRPSFLKGGTALIASPDAKHSLDATRFLVEGASRSLEAERRLPTRTLAITPEVTKLWPTAGQSPAGAQPHAPVNAGYSSPGNRLPGYGRICATQGREPRFEGWVC
jgi:hypothetical protein